MSATTLRCPRCASFLFLAPTDKAHLAGCGRCGGVFLGRASAQRVFEKLEAEVHAMAVRASSVRHPTTVVPRETPAGPCPQCGVVMRPRRVELAGIVVDDCDAHGVWFDHDELEAWMRSVAAMRGGSIGAAPLVAAGAVAVAGAGAVAGAAYVASQSDEVADAAETAAEDPGFGDGLKEGLADAADAVDLGGFVGDLLGSMISSLFD